MKSFLPSRPIRIPQHLIATTPKTPSQQDIERAFARLFSTEDGQTVLAHLQVMTFSRAYGPDTTDQILRHAEGQRALVANILRLVDRGRK